MDDTNRIRYYRNSARLRIALRIGNVLDVSADALLMGKSKTLRSNIERTSTSLSPIARYSLSGQLSHAETPQLPWRDVYSLNYHPRQVPLSSIHVQSLAAAVHFSLLHINRRRGTKRVAIVPFSCRNPEVVAYATIAGLLSVYNFRWWPSATEFVITALDDLTPFQILLDDHSRLARVAAEWEHFVQPFHRYGRPFQRQDIESLEEV